jgi:4-amino-4-deoxy-L-arabinose transferase-like glycosyltransferase
LLSVALLAPGAGGTAVLSQGDEPMHAETVRESLRAGSWAAPILNGAPNYFKPPLLFWAGMASESILGASLFALRLPAILFAAFTVLGIYCLLRLARLSAGVAAAIALAYLLTLGVFKFGRLLMNEQGLALCLVWLTVLLQLGERYRGLRALCSMCAGLIAALGFFWKGPLFVIYASLAFGVWYSPQVFRWRDVKSPGFSGATRLQWRGDRALRSILPDAAAFLIPLAAPIAWATWLEGRGGGAYIDYFLVHENLAKFREPNQPEWRLLEGLLLYTLPWAPALAFFFYRGLRRAFANPLNRSDLLARKLLWLVAAVLLFHLLPNRKDAYYVTPILPHLFMGIALANRDWLLDGPLRRRGVQLATASGVVALLVFHWILLPVLDRPLLPPAARALSGARLCLISAKPWHGYQVRMNYPDLEIVHGLRLVPESCIARGTPIAALVPIDVPANYAITQTWPLWKESGVAARSALDLDLTRFSETAILYLPQSGGAR